MWADSVECYREREREDHRWAWVRYFERMARLHGDLATDYEARAEALLRPPAHTRDKDGSGSYPDPDPEGV